MKKIIAVLIIMTLVAVGIASASLCSQCGWCEPTPAPSAPGYTVDENGWVYGPAVFPNGTPIPDDYVDPFGEELDPRYRVLYIPPEPYTRPVLETLTGENILARISKYQIQVGSYTPRVSRLAQFLNR